MRHDLARASAVSGVRPMCLRPDGSPFARAGVASVPSAARRGLFAGVSARPTGNDGAGEALADAAARPRPVEQAVGTTPRAAGVDWPGPDSPCKGAAQAAASPPLSVRRLCFAGGASSEHADAAGPGESLTRASSSDKAATTFECAEAASSWWEYQSYIRRCSGSPRTRSFVFRPWPLRPLSVVKLAIAHRRCAATSARKPASVFLGAMLKCRDLRLAAASEARSVGNRKQGQCELSLHRYGVSWSQLVSSGHAGISWSPGLSRSLLLTAALSCSFMLFAASCWFLLVSASVPCSLLVSAVL